MSSWPESLAPAAQRQAEEAGNQTHARRHKLPSAVLDRSSCSADNRPAPAVPSAFREGCGTHTVFWPGPRRALRHWSCTVSAVVLAAILAGCGNTDSWVDTVPAEGWPAQYGDAANSSYTATSGATSLTLRWTRSVKGSLASAPALSSRNWMALERADPGRLLADGVGERRQRQATLVHSALPRRRNLRPIVRRLRQPLRRPARGDGVLSPHPVDPLAPTGNRNAFHPKVSRIQSTARRHTPWTGAGFRRSPRHRGRQFRGSGGQRRPGRFHPRALRLRTGPGRLPGRRGAGIRGGERDGGRGPVAAGCPCGRADRVEVSPRSKPAAHPGMDQRRGQRRCAGQPGAVQATAPRFTSTAATSGCGRCMPPTASRNGRCR